MKLVVKFFAYIRQRLKCNLFAKKFYTRNLNHIFPHKFRVFLCTTLLHIYLIDKLIFVEYNVMT